MGVIMAFMEPLVNSLAIPIVPLMYVIKTMGFALTVAMVDSMGLTVVSLVLLRAVHHPANK